VRRALAGEPLHLYAKVKNKGCFRCCLFLWQALDNQEFAAVWKNALEWKYGQIVKLMFLGQTRPIEFNIEDGTLYEKLFLIDLDLVQYYTCKCRCSCFGDTYVWSLCVSVNRGPTGYTEIIVNVYRFRKFLYICPPDRCPKTSSLVIIVRKDFTAEFYI